MKNKLIRLYGLIIGLSSVIFMIILFLGLLKDGIYYFYEFNRTILLIELVIVILSLPILIYSIKEIIQEF